MKPTQTTSDEELALELLKRYLADRGNPDAGVSRTRTILWTL